MKNNVAEDSVSMVTRRSFLGLLTTACAAASMIPGARLFGAAKVACVRPPVVAFHMDQLYVDRTGTAIPYRPPDGYRGAEPLANLSETALRMQYCYL
jgi:hypothetical protein